MEMAAVLFEWLQVCLSVRSGKGGGMNEKTNSDFYERNAYRLGNVAKLRNLYQLRPPSKSNGGRWCLQYQKGSKAKHKEACTGGRAHE
jgi:hypothetical protein